jgi:hypothetical protein
MPSLRILAKRIEQLTSQLNWSLAVTVESLKSTDETIRSFATAHRERWDAPSHRKPNLLICPFACVELLV